MCKGICTSRQYGSVKSFVYLGSTARAAEAEPALQCEPSREWTGCETSTCAVNNDEGPALCEAVPYGSQADTICRKSRVTVALVLAANNKLDSIDGEATNKHSTRWPSAVEVGDMPKWDRFWGPAWERLSLGGKFWMRTSERRREWCRFIALGFSGEMEIAWAAPDGSRRGWVLGYDLQCEGRDASEFRRKSRPDSKDPSALMYSSAAKDM